MIRTRRKISAGIVDSMVYSAEQAAGCGGPLSVPCGIAKARRIAAEVAAEHGVDDGISVIRRGVDPRWMGWVPVARAGVPRAVYIWPGCMTIGVVLHELAHVITPEYAPDHGITWRRRYIELMRRYVPRGRPWIYFERDFARRRRAWYRARRG